MADQFHKIGSGDLGVIPEHGLVCGWASVSKVDNGSGLEPYYDLGWTGADGVHYRDHVTEGAILKAALDYMSGDRVAAEAHKTAALVELQAAVDRTEDPVTKAAMQELVDKAEKASFPPPLYDRNSNLKAQKAKPRGFVPFAFPLLSDMLEPLGIQSQKTGLLIGMKPDPALFARYRSGEVTQFSIGGRRDKDVVVGEVE